MRERRGRPDPTSNRPPDRGGFFRSAALIGASILSGCAAGKPYEIRFMPPTAFLGEGSVEPFQSVGPVETPADPEILYATLREPAGPGSEDRFYTSDRAGEVRLGKGRIVLGRSAGAVSWRLHRGPTTIASPCPRHDAPETLHEPCHLQAVRRRRRDRAPLHAAMRDDIRERVGNVEDMRQRPTIEASDALDTVVNDAFVRAIERLLIATGWPLRGRARDTPPPVRCPLERSHPDPRFVPRSQG